MLVAQCDNRQSGQALVLALVILGPAITALIWFFNTATVVGFKTHQTNALDAASYSGALVQARALNFLAYINRAQVGHHIAMAHLVTLGSWAHFAGTESRQLAQGNPPAHLITMMFGANHGRAYMAAVRASGFIAKASTSGELASAYGQHDKTVSKVFTDVQSAVVNSVPDVRYQTMLAVLNSNYKYQEPNNTATELDLTIYDDGWSAYIKLNAGQKLRAFVAKTADLYKFLAPRDHTARNSWVVDARCPSRRHQLRRRGKTEMDSQGRWQSIDTQSFHALRSNRWIGCYFREYSMGWGWIPTAAQQNIGDQYTDSPPDNFSAQDFWRWVQESTNWNITDGSANPLANSKAVADRQRWYGGGLQNYFDIRNPAQNKTGFKTVLNLRGVQGLSYTTYSAAETFFDRPESRTDKKTELPNLFRPYWQARLAPADSTYSSTGAP